MLILKLLLNAGPFQIRKKINSTIYVVDLPSDFCGNYTFNVDDLIPCRGILDTHFNPLVDEPTHDFPSESPLLPLLPPKLSHVAENIDYILVDQIVSSRDGGTPCYLVKWRERSESENS